VLQWLLCPEVWKNMGRQHSTCRLVTAVQCGVNFPRASLQESDAAAQDAQHIVVALLD
jgi:hypothetical protein